MKPPTIAQQWQEWQQGCFPRRTDAELLEQRMAFYAGWHSLIRVMTRMDTSDVPGGVTAVQAWNAEFLAQSHRYLQALREELERLRTEVDEREAPP